MSESDVLTIANQAIEVAARISGPILAVSLAVGTLISLVQALTQIQEMTLTFVPKLVGIAAVLVVAGGWMLRELAEFTRGLYDVIPSLLS